MAVVYVIVAIFAGSEFITENLSNGTNSIIYSLQQAGSFAAGVFVILAGVRLILAEIVPAFKGFLKSLFLMRFLHWIVQSSFLMRQMLFWLVF